MNNVEYIITELPFAINNNYNSCYTFWLRYKDCSTKEILGQIMCREKFDDYVECKFKIKHKQFQTWYGIEFKKLKILSLPQYDDVTDSFYDSKAPTSADSFFNNSDAMKKFFSDEAPLKSHTQSHHN